MKDYKIKRKLKNLQKREREGDEKHAFFFYSALGLEVEFYFRVWI